MNIIKKILEEMQSDDRNTATQANKLEALYAGATKEGKQLLDAAITCICGWSLKTLTKGE
jgi:hypothetical protein